MTERETIGFYLQEMEEGKKYSDVITASKIFNWSKSFAPNLSSYKLNQELAKICDEGRIERLGKIGRNDSYKLVAEVFADLSLCPIQNNAYKKWVESNKSATLPCLDHQQKVGLIAHAWSKLKGEVKFPLNGLIICKKPDQIERWVDDLDRYGITVGAFGGSKSEWLVLKNFWYLVEKTIKKIQEGGVHIKKGVKLLIIDECDGYFLDGKSRNLFNAPSYWKMHFPDQTPTNRDVYALPPWLRVSNVKKMMLPNLIASIFWIK